MRIACALLAGAAVLMPVRADEGLWTFDNPPLAHLRATYGWAPDAAWLARAMHASVRMSTGCSGAFVSAAGLVLTNQHCAEDCLQQLTTAEHDLMRDGFLAPTPAGEQRCPGLSVERLDEITDVTARITRATQGAHGDDYARRRSAEIAGIESECGASHPGSACEVIDLYRGGMQSLYRFHRYDDVRLAFAPEFDIAQFGGDPDNFEFPRYDLDMAILRVWENGRPAPTAERLRFRARPAAAGELAIAIGSPGRTERQLTLAQLETLRDLESPWRVMRLAEQRGLLVRYAQESADNARAARDEIDAVENGFKERWGEQSALMDAATFARKRAQEQALRDFAQSHAEMSDARGAWDAIAAAERVRRAIALRLRFTEQGQGLWSQYFVLARNLVRAAVEQSRPDAARLPEFSSGQLAATQRDTLSDAPVDPGLERVKLAWSLTKMREWLGPDDPLVRAVLGRESPDVLAARWVAATRLADVAVRRALWQGGQAAIEASEDPFIRLAELMEPESRRLRHRQESEVDAPELRSEQSIARVRFALAGTGAYPDATGSPRLSFGIVAGWDDGRRVIGPVTTVAGLDERATDAEPYRLPARWRDARDRLAPQAPMNFATTDDLVGGSSGSPLLDREGYLIGLAFDGNIESLSGAFEWDDARGRAVAVEGPFMLEALDAVYHADALLAELRGGP